MSNKIVVFGRGYVSSNAINEICTIALSTKDKQQNQASSVVKNIVSIARSPYKAEGNPLLANVEKRVGKDISVVHECADMLKPDTYRHIVQGADSVVIAVGVPPLPTLTNEAYLQQRRMTAEPSLAAINVALEENVKRVCFVSAWLPFDRLGPKGYVEGKMLVEKYIETSSLAHPQISFSILKPSVVTGTRYTSSGTSIPLWVLFSPVTTLMRSNAFRSIPGLSQILPPAPIPVEVVGRCAALHSLGLVDASHYPKKGDASILDVDNMFCLSEQKLN